MYIIYCNDIIKYLYFDLDPVVRMCDIYMNFCDLDLLLTLTSWCSYKDVAMMLSSCRSDFTSAMLVVKVDSLTIVALDGDLDSDDLETDDLADDFSDFREFIDLLNPFGSLLVNEACDWLVGARSFNSIGCSISESLLSLDEE